MHIKIPSRLLEIGIAVLLTIWPAFTGIAAINCDDDLSPASTGIPAVSLVEHDRPECRIAGRRGSAGAPSQAQV